MNPIPFNRAAVTGREAEYVTRAIAEGPIHGDGPFTKTCHEWLERLTGSPKALLTTSCTHALEMSALLLDLRRGRRGDRAVLHLRVHGQRLRAARRAAGVRGHPARHAEHRRVGDRGRHHPAHARHRAGALRRRRLRDGRHHGDRRAARAGGGRGQRARPVRHLQGPPAGHLRRPGHAELPRDQELVVRRGRGADDQRRALRRAGRDHPREGHQPQPLLPRAGGQVHLVRRRLELSAVRHPRRLPAGAARIARADSGAAATRCGTATTRRWRPVPRPPACGCPSSPSTATTPRTSSTC